MTLLRCKSNPGEDNLIPLTLNTLNTPICWIHYYLNPEYTHTYGKQTLRRQNNIPFSIYFFLSSLTSYSHRLTFSLRGVLFGLNKRIISWLFLSLVSSNRANDNFINMYTSLTFRLINCSCSTRTTNSFHSFWILSI